MQNTGSPNTGFRNTRDLSRDWSGLPRMPSRPKHLCFFFLFFFPNAKDLRPTASNALSWVERPSKEYSTKCPGCAWLYYAPIRSLRLGEAKGLDPIWTSLGYGTCTDHMVELHVAQPGKALDPIRASSGYGTCTDNCIQEAVNPRSKLEIPASWYRTPTWEFQKSAGRSAGTGAGKLFCLCCPEEPDLPAPVPAPPFLPALVPAPPPALFWNSHFEVLYQVAGISILNARLGSMERGAWRGVGRKGWQRVSLHPPIFNSQNARLEERVC